MKNEALKPNATDDLTEAEIAARFESTIRRMANTKPSIRSDRRVELDSFATDETKRSSLAMIEMANICVSEVQNQGSKTQRIVRESKKGLARQNRFQPESRDEVD